MIDFSTNKNQFLSTINTLQADMYSFASLGVAKDTRNYRQRKRILLSTVSAALEDISTSEYGIRIILLKTND